MILETDVAFVVLTTAVVQELECERPLLLRELGGLEHIGPLWSPQMVLNHVDTVLSVYDSSFVNHNLRCVPLAVRFLVLWFSWDHIVKGSGLAVAVDSEHRVRMVRIVKHLIFRRRNVDRRPFCSAVGIILLDFLSEVENARVSALGDLPFEFKLEVLELVGEDQVAALTGLSLAGTGAGELDASVFNGPA